MYVMTLNIVGDTPDVTVECLTRPFVGCLHDYQLTPGDLVALLDAGAYGMAMSSNYNTRPRPAEVLVEGAKARLIRRRETMADLLGPEIF